MAFALGKLPSQQLDAAHEHLDACAACQQVLTDAAHALGTAVTDGETFGKEAEHDTTFRRGALVGGRYEIREFIARGGMGEVYEAFDRDLRERVALKTVSSTACDNTRAVKRLKAEVQLARRVSHPNVCRIYDFGSHALEGTGAQLNFLTMEFVEGETLGQRVRLAGELPEIEARQIARELLLGLRAAHEAGVLHRDFKSDNVMLKVGPDGRSSAVILDFGLARAADGPDGASGSNSQLVGTFGYIAPERLDGRPYTTGGDVYAFGVVWFEMLTGELPFNSSAPRSESVLRTIQRPHAPSHRNQSVPPEIDAIVLRCLDRSPNTRYQTVAEVLQALDAVEAAASPGWRRKLFPVALASCVAAAFLYFLAGNATTSERAAPTAINERKEPPVVPSPPELPPAPMTAPVASVLAPTPDPLPPVPRATPARESQPRSRAAEVAHQELALSTPAIAAPSASAQPAAAATESPDAASVPSSTTPVRSFTGPASAPPRPTKPDWENPFSGAEVELAARTKGKT